MAERKSSAEAAKAVTSLLRLDPDDQEALRKVVEDYFTQPTKDNEDDYIYDDDENEQLEMHNRGETNEEIDCEVNEAISDDDDGEDDPMGLDKPFHEALQNIPLVPDLDIQILPNDEFQKDIVAGFMDNGCKCTTWKGKSCSFQFSKAEVEDVRSSCWALSHTQLDMVVLGQTNATSSWSDTTDSSFGHSPRPRKHNYMKYFHQGKSICPTMFRFLHTIGEKRLKNLVQSFKENGVAPRVHRNTKRLPHNTISMSSTKYVVRFLLNFADQNCLLLPGRIPGYSRSDIKLLPSSLSKRGVWKKYHESADSAETIHPVSYSSFCSLWRSLLPSIVVMKPMSDLCFECQKNSTAIVRSANCPSTEKSLALKKAEEHLRLVHLERSFYKSTIDECRQTVQSHFKQNGSFVAPEVSSKIAPNSKAITVHYSFDYAQTVHYPSDPLQPGPIYFLTPRKCSVFGVHCEALPRQVNFLIDEAGDCGKGANAVVSMLHFFFDVHGLGEQVVFLHADNCTGQNKNNTMMQYLLWRCLTGRHKMITLSFLVVGHTKFAPDWCFGLFKRLFRRSKVGSLSGIAHIVEESAKCNFAQLVCSENGDVIVPVFNWTSFFATRFRKLTGIKKLNHFKFNSLNPGVVTVKAHCDTSESQMNLMKAPWSPSASDLPSVINPKPMTPERQWYLYNQIRPFCPENEQNITCPLPSVAMPTSRSCTPVPPDTTDELDYQVENHSCKAPPQKKKRLPSICKRKGHEI